MQVTQTTKRRITGGKRYSQSTRFKEFIRQRDNYTCQTCGATVDNLRVKQLDVAHIVPYSECGTTTPDNVRVLCHSCNQMERTFERRCLPLDEYYARLEAEREQYRHGA